jgi:hypothetical protein
VGAFASRRHPVTHNEATTNAAGVGDSRRQPARAARLLLAPRGCACSPGGFAKCAFGLAVAFGRAIARTRGTFARHALLRQAPNAAAPPPS